MFPLFRRQWITWKQKQIKWKSQSFFLFGKAIVTSFKTLKIHFNSKENWKRLFFQTNESFPELFFSIWIFSEFFSPFCTKDSRATILMLLFVKAEIISSYQGNSVDERIKWNKTRKKIYLLNASQKTIVGWEKNARKNYQLNENLIRNARI